MPTRGKPSGNSLRVAIDATPLTVPTGGTRRYVVELTRALAQEFPDDEFHLLSDQSLGTPPGELLGLENLRFGLAGGTRWAAKWWSLGLPWELRRRRIDVFHGTDFAIPYLPLRPSVLVIHDLSPWKRGPRRARAAARIRRRTPYLLRLATQITTHSEAVRRELSDFFGIAPSKITAVPLAAAGTFCRQVGSSLTERLRRLGIDRPYLLFVGDRNERKNLPLLIDAWRGLPNNGEKVSLVLVGKPGLAEIETLQEPGLHILGPLKDKDVEGLLSGALAFVYPSLYEGFGLPVLEAMKVGVPVVTSYDPAITEVAGGAALQVDVTSREELTQALVAVTTSSPLRSSLEERGSRRAAQFTWRSTAHLTHAVYDKAIRGF